MRSLYLNKYIIYLINRTKCRARGTLFTEKQYFYSYRNSSCIWPQEDTFRTKKEYSKYNIVLFLQENMLFFLHRRNIKIKVIIYIKKRNIKYERNIL